MKFSVNSSKLNLSIPKGLFRGWTKRNEGRKERKKGDGGACSLVFIDFLGGEKYRNERKFEVKEKIKWRLAEKKHGRICVDEFPSCMTVSSSGCVASSLRIKGATSSRGIYARLGQLSTGELRYILLLRLRDCLCLPFPLISLLPGRSCASILFLGVSGLTRKINTYERPLYETRERFSTRGELLALKLMEFLARMSEFNALNFRENFTVPRRRIRPNVPLDKTSRISRG